MSLLLNTTTEGTHPFEVILRNGDSIARDKVTVVAGQNLKVGAVLGVITASGKYAEHDPDATDGSENAAAVLLADCDATAGDATALVLNRYAEVKSALLVFKASITAPQKAAALAALAAKNIVAR